MAPAWADHPMLTGDTDVLDKGQWELELHGERARDRENGVRTRASNVAATLARGITDKLEAEIELPFLREVTGGNVTQGRGDVSVSAKWRFYERDAVSLAVKPTLLLPTGRDDEGLGAGRMRWATTLAAAYALGRIELLANLGYLRNRNQVGEPAHVWQASAALRYTATDKLKLVLDNGKDSSPDPAARAPGRDLVLGVIYEPRDGIELGLGLKRGLNDEADDRALRAGIKIRW